MSAAKPVPDVDVAALRAQCDDAERKLGEALALLRDSPTRQRLMNEFYWPWKRKVEVFLMSLDTPSAAEVEGEAQAGGRDSWVTGDPCVTGGAGS